MVAVSGDQSHTWDGGAPVATVAGQFDVEARLLEADGACNMVLSEDI